MDEARAELAVVAAERKNFNAELVRKQEELSGMRAQMAEVQREVERLHAVEEELAVASVIKNLLAEKIKCDFLDQI